MTTVRGMATSRDSIPVTVGTFEHWGEWDTIWGNTIWGDGGPSEPRSENIYIYVYTHIYMYTYIYIYRAPGGGGG